jgi:crotonobetainyl-CoA:carnitine CoA-transferase CaiB-like acyl-CoA transferase
VTPSSVPYGDVVLPPIMAASVAAAVRHARQSGQGVHIDASMYEACVQQMASAIRAAQLGQQPQRTGNDDSEALFQVVMLSGTGHHLAIRVADRFAWDQLGRVVGGKWDEPEKMLSAARRRETEAHIRFWLERHEPWEAMAELQKAGIAAGVVQTAADIVDRDPQLKQRGILVDLDNPALGRFAHQASPIRMSRTPAAMRTAPGLGQHTHFIATSIAGLSEARFAELAAAGLFE